MAKIKKTKIETPEKHFASDDKNICVYEIYRRSKKTVYYLRGTQAKHLSKIILNGFEGIPSGLYLNRNGFGFGKKGVFLLSALKDHLAAGKLLEFIISNKNNKKVQKGSLKVSITIPSQDVKIYS